MFLLLLKLRKLLLPFIKKIVFKVIPDLNPIFPVEKIVRSIPEVILKKPIAQHITSMTVIRNACIENYGFTKDLPSAFRSEMHFARRHVYRLNKITINVRTGACFSDKHAFLESFGSLRSWLLARPIRSLNSDGFELNLPITCINSTGYAHYIMEEIPRLLWVLKLYPEVRLVCPAKIPSYAETIYSELRKRNILQFEPIRLSFDNISVNDYIFSQAEAYSGFWNKLDIEILRNTFIIRETCSRKKCIYISRRNSNRTFWYEEELEQALIKFNFEIVFLETLKFTEQIELFSDAEIVIGSHGAGLANLVWCSPTTKVIEIFPTTVFNDCFSRLSSQLSLIHYCIGWDDGENADNSMVINVIDLLGRIC